MCSEQGRGTERDRERERIPIRLCTVSIDPDEGFHSTNWETVT